MIRKTLVSAILLIPSASMAAIPPYWDSVRQIEAILQSELKTQLDGPVVQIQKVGELTYAVTSKNCQATVNLQGHKTDVPLAVGATSYTVKKVTSTCK